MFVYPQQNGKYLGSLLFDTQIASIFGRIFQFDTTGMVIGYGKERTTEQNLPPLFAVPSFFKMGTKDLYIPERNDAIFQIIDEELVPYACLGLGKLMMPDEIYFNRNASQEEKSNYIFSLSGHGLNENEFVVEFRVGKQNYWAFCNVNNGHSKLIKKNESGIPNDNDIDGGPPLNGFYYTTIQNGYLYRASSPVYLKTDLEEGAFLDPSSDLRAFINGLDLEDNPVIIKMKLKDQILK